MNISVGLRPREKRKDIEKRRISEIQGPTSLYREKGRGRSEVAGSLPIFWTVWSLEAQGICENWPHRNTNVEVPESSEDENDNQVEVKRLRTIVSTPKYVEKPTALPEKPNCGQIFILKKPPKKPINTMSFH